MLKYDYKLLSECGKKYNTAFNNFINIYDEFRYKNTIKFSSILSRYTEIYC